jgi:hypothetical protein
MIADVDEIDSGGEFSPQLWWEKKKFVQVSKPFGNEVAGELNSA